MTHLEAGGQAALIREIQPRDLAGILHLTHIIPEAPAWGIEDFRKLVSSNAASANPSLTRVAWVAESHSRLLGLVVVQHLLVSGEGNATGECELESILVDPDRRRAGLGRQLLSQAMRWCLKEHAAALRLEVRVSNVAAIRLYEKNGFTHVGRRPRYYAHPEEDALLMQLDLADQRRPRNL